MKNIYIIISEAQDGTMENMVFSCGSKISNENISANKNLPIDIPETSIYVDTGSYSFDLKLDKEFDIIFAKNNPKDFIKIQSIFKYISINANYEIDYLPKGYSGIGLVDFPQGKPEILNKLSEFRSEEKSKTNDTLYLTTQSVMDKILENLD